MTDWNSDTPPDPARRGDATEGPGETFRADLPRPKGPPAKGGRRRGRGVLVWLGVAVLLLAVIGGVSALTGYVYVRQHYLQDVPAIPPREQLYALNRAPAIKFFDRTGALIASRGPNFGDRITLRQLPPHVPRAFLAAEDKRFYSHGPVDIIGIARAAYVNHRAGRVVQGGSTLSQQLAKGLFLTPEQNLKRKVQEAVIALRLERMLTKDEVLELYLNRTYFGANAFGVDGAARAYFGKPASQLTLSEAALLAALPKAPSRMALTRNMSAALARQRLILDTMLGEGWITAQEEAEALRDPPRLRPDAMASDGDMGYALDYATSEVVRLVGPNSPDLMVRLTIDPDLQAAGGKALREVVRGEGARAGASQGAIVALSFDGAIRTMVGGLDYSQSVFNRAVQARRQPGSSFKPFVYATALERGILPSDVRIDEPVKFGDWAPENYGGGYRGAVTVSTALAQSINTVAVKLAQETGGAAIGDLARRFGVTTLPPDPNLSIALGAYEVPLLEMVSGYQVFQNQGQRVTPYIVDEITSIDGHQLYLHRTSSPSPAYDLPHASMMVRMMEQVITSGTGTRADFGRPAAGKTGTSQNWRDAWFIGFTPDVVAGVWVGNDNETPMNRVTGGVLPAEIWRRYMITAHARIPARDFDWLLPDPVPEGGLEDSDLALGDPGAMEDDGSSRGAFYDELSSDFDTEARGAPGPNESPDREIDDPPVDDGPQ
ncbi:MAG TPA: PBP1A family penicillin-binding protein [Phenylobacterium sp.]|nr:PBP1A family penicillin-binding protein [Phenylobacterium sp.]